MKTTSPKRKWVNKGIKLYPRDFAAVAKLQEDLGLDFTNLVRYLIKQEAQRRGVKP